MFHTTQRAFEARAPRAGAPRCTLFEIDRRRAAAARSYAWVPRTPCARPHGYDHGLSSPKRAPHDRRLASIASRFDLLAVLLPLPPSVLAVRSRRKPQAACGAIFARATLAESRLRHSVSHAGDAASYHPSRHRSSRGPPPRLVPGLLTSSSSPSSFCSASSSWRRVSSVPRSSALWPLPADHWVPTLGASPKPPFPVRLVARPW